MMERTRTILVPIDSDDQSVVALNQSYNLAKLTQSKIVLLSIDNGKATNIKEKLDVLAKDAALKSGQPVEVKIKKGQEIYDEINKVADQIRPLFMVIGLKRIQDGKFRGKNALEMIRKSNHPIISVAGKTHNEGCKKVLMPLDLSVLSREKVARTIGIAKMFNAEMHVFSVINKESKIEENKLHMYAAQCLKYVSEAGLHGFSKFVHSNEDVASLVLAHAQKINADLIVIISNDERNIKEYFKGTAAQRLINNSDIPVLTLRPLERRDMTQAIF